MLVGMHSKKVSSGGKEEAPKPKTMWSDKGQTSGMGIIPWTLWCVWPCFLSSRSAVCVEDTEFSRPQSFALIGRVLGPLGGQEAETPEPSME